MICKKFHGCKIFRIEVSKHLSTEGVNRLAPLGCSQYALLLLGAEKMITLGLDMPVWRLWYSWGFLQLAVKQARTCSSQSSLFFFQPFQCPAGVIKSKLHADHHPPRSPAGV